AYQGIDGDVVLDVTLFVEDAVLAMSGEGVQGDVSDHPQLREARAQGASRALGNTVRVPGFGTVQGFLLDRGNREQRQRRNTQLDPRLRSFQQQVDRQALDARHRGHFFTTVLAVQHEHRQNQVVDGQYVFANQATREFVTTVATQAGGRKQ